MQQLSRSALPFLCESLLLREEHAVRSRIAALDKDIALKSARLEVLTMQRMATLLSAAQVNGLHQPPYVRAALDPEAAAAAAAAGSSSRAQIH